LFDAKNSQIVTAAFIPSLHQPMLWSAAWFKGLFELAHCRADEDGLQPVRTAREILEGPTLERPSCGGFVPTAETTLLPAYSATSKRLLTNARD